MPPEPDHDLDPSVLQSQTAADGSAQGVKRQLEALLSASLGDSPRSRQLADVLLSDFHAAQTNAAIASEYTRCAHDGSQQAPDDWDADGLQELAATGAVRAAVSALDSPASKAATEDAASAVLHDEHRLMVYSLGGGVQQPRTVDAAVAALQQMAAAGGEGEQCAWLDVTDPTADELLRLARAFGLHPLTVEDILAGDTGGDKAEWLGRTLVVIYRALHLHPMGVCGVSMVVRERLVLTFHGAAASVHVHEALVRLLGQQQQPAPAGEHAWLVAYALVDAVTDGLALAMRAVEEEVQAADALAMGAAAQGGVGLRRIGEARRRLLGVWRVLLGKPEVARALAKEAGATAGGGDLGHYLADVIDHLDALLALCVQCEAVLGRAHANHSAGLALALAETSVGAGAFAGQWMVLAGVLLPMQFVAGLFGQNVHVPWMWDKGAGAHDNLHAWLAIMGSLALFFVALVAVLRIRRTI
ncbi:hypothetical protein LPJ53_001616 [Coemansia erecta]|uniref:Cora-domain-containing protein n=1 Tax=Coemansia erecta TaxID=147472 RepID=A0A9W7Y611_9FUNG|nr:hypothetical protein LPJ53_001616 [Coemansia erecta]